MNAKLDKLIGSENAHQEFLKRRKDQIDSDQLGVDVSSNDQDMITDQLPNVDEDIDDLPDSEYVADSSKKNKFLTFKSIKYRSTKSKLAPGLDILLGYALQVSREILLFKLVSENNKYYSVHKQNIP